MLKDNLKTLRKNKGLSQEELSIKLHVVRQTVSKWELGLSVPDAEMLITISEILETPVSKILGENIEEKENNDLKVISKKLEVINEQLSMKQEQKRKRIIDTLVIVDVCLILLFILLAVLKSPYQTWDYSNPEWFVIGTLWHSFEWIYFKVAPLMIIVITVILGIVFALIAAVVIIWIRNCICKKKIKIIHEELVNNGKIFKDMVQKQQATEHWKL